MSYEIDADHTRTYLLLLRLRIGLIRITRYDWFGSLWKSTC